MMPFLDSATLLFYPICEGASSMTRAPGTDEPLGRLPGDQWSGSIEKGRRLGNNVESYISFSYVTEDLGRFSGTT